MKRPQPAELVAASDVLANFIRRDKSRYPADVMAALEKLEDESAYGGFDFPAPAVPVIYTPGLGPIRAGLAAAWLSRALFDEVPASLDSAEREELQALIADLETPDPAAAWTVPEEFRPKVEAGEYLVTVAFVRSLEDDRDVIAGLYPGATEGHALAQQLARELQEGFDEASIAGRFQALSVFIPEPADEAEPEGTDGPGGPVALTDWGGRVLGRFPTIASAEGFLSTSATIDPDHLHAGRYGIEAPHGLGADVEAVPLARALGFSCFWSMGGAYYAPPGVATTGNDSGKGWKGGFDSIEAAALAALATVDPEAVTISPASVPAPPEEEADDFPESLSAFTRGGEGERLGYVPRKPR